MSNESSALRVEIGDHEVVVENSILLVRFQGIVSLDEAKQIQACIYDAGDRFGKLGALANLNNLAQFESGARAYLVRPSRPYPIHTVAYYGGNYASRMVIQTMARAGRLLVPFAFTFEMAGFETEEAARRYLKTAHAKYGKNA